MTGTAVLSDCGTYRYELTRTWGDGPGALWIMLNPSIADADVDDPTIRKITRLTKGWELGGLVVVNLFALRSSDPRMLERHPSPVGPDNDETIRRWALSPAVDRVICAWGDGGVLANRGLIVRERLLRQPRPVWCLGTTRGGHPRHPRFVKGDVDLVEYRW